jgi:pyrroloquinoline quinone biosynthesis protein D
MKIARNEEIFFRKEVEGEEELSRFLQEGEASDKGYLTLIDAGTMHQLNYLGGRIWELCDGTRNLNGIVEALLGDFDIKEEELKSDVEDFIEDLIERGWLSYG